MANTMPMMPKQSEAIMAFMETHDKFKAGKAIGLDPKRVKADTLSKLVVITNSNGPEKTGKQIMDWWKNIRQKAKKYNAKRKAAMKATGNVSDTAVKENPLYEKVLRIVGTSHGNGLPIIPEVGTKDIKMETEECENQVKTEERPNVIVFNKAANRSPLSLLSNVQPTVSSLNETISAPSTSAGALSSQGNREMKSGILTGIENLQICSSKRSMEEDYARKFAGYSTAYKKKPSKLDVRTVNTLNALSDGNNTMLALANVAKDVADTNIERNKLLSENNLLLQALLDKLNK